jgi:hypothetical protein
MMFFWYLKKQVKGEWIYRTCSNAGMYAKLLKWGWYRITQEEYELATG